MSTRRFFVVTGIAFLGILMAFFCFRTDLVKAGFGTSLLRSLFVPPTVSAPATRPSALSLTGNNSDTPSRERDKPSTSFLRRHLPWLQRITSSLHSIPLLPVSPPTPVLPTRYSLSGRVTGISGTIILRTNDNDTVSISPGQPALFTFARSIPNGSVYHVAIEQVPPGQHCSLSHQANGTIQGRNVMDIYVACAPLSQILPVLQEGTGGGGGSIINTAADPVIPTRYTIGGSISGLDGMIVLQNNSGDNLSLSSDGAFTFATTVLDGGTYAITLLSQPADQTCVITFGSGTVSHTDVSAVRVTCTDNLIVPTISLGSITKVFGDAAFTPSPTSDSPGTFTYSTDDVSVATVAGTTVTIVGVGSTTITAIQAAAGAYTSGSVTTTLSIARATPNLVFDAITKTYGDASFALSVTSTSPASFTYTSGSSTIALITGETVTIVGAGTATLTASQATSSNYTAASATTTLTINRATPSISFNDITKTYGDAPFTLSSISNSPGSISYICTDAGIATIVSDVATIVGAGTTTITLTQATSTNYMAFSQIANLFVQTIAPTISLSPIVKYITSGPFTPSPTSTSSGLFTYASSNASVATASGDTVTLTGVGTTVLTANQAAAGNYRSGSATTTLRVYANECITGPCFNGGICTPNLDSFQCSCEAPFSGSLCELSDANCSPDSPGQCLNGGACMPTVFGGECACAACWMGAQCDEYDSITCA